MKTPTRTERRIVLSEDCAGRARGFYVSFVCRYRDENDYALRQIGGLGESRVTLLDSGEFYGGASPAERAAVREYERQCRAEFIEWCVSLPHKPNPADYPPHAILVGAK